jgi:hypothetical protein
LSFSYWIDYLGFITKGKLAAIFIKPSLGVSNWPVIYFINYKPISSLAPFITAPSTSFLASLPGIELHFPTSTMLQQNGKQWPHHRWARPGLNRTPWW